MRKDEFLLNCRDAKKKVQELSRPRALSGFIVLASIATIALLLVSTSRSNAASSSDFSSTNSTLVSAYTAAVAAEHHGGNVSQLAAQLNAAITLYQRAAQENRSNPSAASFDLQNSSRIASAVISEAPGISAAGASAVEYRDALSITGATAIAAVAVLLYFFGGRIYRRLWYYLYRDYVVVASDNDR